MVNYQDGRIYSIRSYLRPDLVYIGATCRILSERHSEHKRNIKCSSKIITLLGDSYIELIENFPCNSKEELRKREGEFIRIMDCVNKNIAGRTPSEWENDRRHRIRNQRPSVIEFLKKQFENHDGEYMRVRACELCRLYKAWGNVDLSDRAFYAELKKYGIIKKRMSIDDSLVHGFHLVKDEIFSIS
jgi:hypothetical protein